MGPGVGGGGVKCQLGGLAGVATDDLDLNPNALKPGSIYEVNVSSTQRGNVLKGIQASEEALRAQQLQQQQETRKALESAPSTPSSESRGTLPGDKTVATQPPASSVTGIFEAVFLEVKGMLAHNVTPKLRDLEKYQTAHAAYRLRLTA